MPFLVQVGHEYHYLPELIANGDLEGIVLQVTHAGLAGVSDIARRGGMVLVDPQTYKLADANVRITRGMESEPFFALWPGAGRLRNAARRSAFVEGTVDRQLAIGATEIISPYLYIEDVNGPALENTLEMGEDCRRIVGRTKRVWTGLYVAGGELKRPLRCDQLLNRLTASSADHCYLIVDPEQGGNAPISDPDLVRGLRKTVKALEANGIHVMLGYSDPLGLLLMADGLSGFASGVTASLRRLRMSAQRRTGGGGHRPLNRYYFPALMNFLLADNELRPAMARLSNNAAPCSCRYCAANFSRGTSYDAANGNRHFIARLTQDARTMSLLTEPNRVAEAKKLVNRAARAYDLLDQAGISLSNDSGPDHVAAWAKSF
ncbi:MAG: hypothetical protein ABSG55_06780 [Dehalococcoidia bacterium]|jgi:hypothetical protein